MKLRWHYEKVKVTAEMVHDERLCTGEVFSDCKKRLEAKTPKVLQFWISLSGEDDDHGYWENVPTVCEFVDDTNDCSVEVEE